MVRIGYSLCFELLSFYDVCSVFFFFKQKTAYEMRISDWSSDVCSSDLVRHRAHARLRAGARRGAGPGRVRSEAHRSRCRRRAARAPGDAAVRAACAPATSPVGAAEGAGLCSLSCEGRGGLGRSEGHTSELQSLMRSWVAVLCWEQ